MDISILIFYGFVIFSHLTIRVIINFKAFTEMYVVWIKIVFVLLSWECYHGVCLDL